MKSKVILCNLSKKKIYSLFFYLLLSITFFPPQSIFVLLVCRLLLYRCLRFCFCLQVYERWCRLFAWMRLYVYDFLNYNCIVSRLPRKMSVKSTHSMDGYINIKEKSAIQLNNWGNKYTISTEKNKMKKSNNKNSL